ncbi:fimbrial protein [Enterobacter mori]|uniref:fimbrial protein n=1 Tax=Enterobacter mori TaxID=539813 RepID=UPI001BE00C9C|nr:fimbrial protein [Enterobacter mori]MBT1872224.1 fimbrial protein [Enterobacter mori]
MNKIWMFFAIGLFSAPLLAANTGICTTSAGTPFHSVLPFYGKKISAQQNHTGQMFDYPTTNSETYPGRCACSEGSALFYNIYYTAIINEALTPSTSHSGLKYFSLNDYLDVGLSIEILGRGYVKAPFENEPNKPTSYYDCGRIRPLEFTSGDSAILYFYVKEPFIGTATIPQTLIARLFATINTLSTIDYSKPLADVYIAGDITAPQECTINGGQVIEVNFGKIPASDFTATPGAVLTDRKIPVKASVSCSGMSAGQDVEVSLHATQAGSLPTVIETTNPDVGIKMYDEYENEVDVNGGRMQTDMGPRSWQGDATGVFNFSAAPASATGTRPAPGEFDANVTITMEIKN